MTEEFEPQPPAFSFTINFNLAVRRDGAAVKLEHKIDSSLGPARIVYKGSTDLPSNLFKDDEQLRKFVAAVYRTFADSALQVMMEEALLTLNDAVHFTLDHMGIDTVDLREQAKLHARQTAQRVRQHFKLPSTGQPSLWTKDELAKAVTDAINTLAPRERNYNRVSERLREVHGEKAPQTGEALRKLLSRFRLDWKKLKTGQYIINTVLNKSF